MSDAVELPLFPLHTVLFPDGPLPLRVFEPRYLDMISTCMKRGSSFGVCLIREGAEIGGAARTFEVGTYATVHDWHLRHDGLLGITVRGGERFRIVREEVRPNQLLVAAVEPLAVEPHVDVPEEHLGLTDMVRRILDQVAHRYADLPTRYADASWVGFRLAELLPLRLAQKQYFLQLTDPIERLERLAMLLEHLEIQT